jgi:glycosyltransferase involved in cell wall biosynthesis
MNIPLFSIIIPVYNADKYLSKCIDSIISQTFTDFELVLINDGSSDNSGMICEEYAKKDSRIHTFHKENGGVSSARNLGLDKANGEWITFVDADDWLADNFLERMLNIALELNVEAVFCDCFYVFENESVPKRSYTENTVGNGSDMLKRFLLRFGTRSELWGKIIKRKYLHHRLKTNLKIGEDFLYLLELYAIDSGCDFKSRTELTAITTDCLYYYRQLDSSVMNNSNLAFHNKELLMECLQFLRQHPEIETENLHEKSVFILRLVAEVIKRDFRNQCKDAFMVNLLRENYANAESALLRREKRFFRALFIHPVGGLLALEAEKLIRKYVFKERKME